MRIASSASSPQQLGLRERLETQLVDRIGGVRYRARAGRSPCGCTANGPSGLKQLLDLRLERRSRGRASPDRSPSATLRSVTMRALMIGDEGVFWDRSVEAITLESGLRAAQGFRIRLRAAGTQEPARSTRATLRDRRLPAAVRARQRRSVSKRAAREQTTANKAERTAVRRSARSRSGEQTSAAISPRMRGRIVPQHRHRVVKLVGPQQQKFHALVPRQFRADSTHNIPGGM